MKPTEPSLSKLPKNIQQFLNRQIAELADQFIHYIKQPPKIMTKSSVEYVNEKENKSQQVSVFSTKGISKRPKKYNNYSLDFKKKLINSIKKEEEDCEQSTTKIIRLKAKLLGIHPKNIYRWYKDGDNLKEKEGGRKPAYPEMEEQLNQFIHRHPDVKRRCIIEKAQQIMKQLGYTEKKGHRFNFSKGWYQRFRARKNLNTKKIREKHLDSNHEQQEESVPLQKDNQQTFKPAHLDTESRRNKEVGLDIQQKRLDEDDNCNRISENIKQSFTLRKYNVDRQKKHQ